MFLCVVFLNQESLHRNSVTAQDKGLDFEVDLTDLETFGEMTSMKTTKTQKIQNDSDAWVKSKKPPSAPTLTKCSSEHLVKTSSTSQEVINTSSTDTDEPTTEETTQPTQSENTVPKTEQRRLDSVQEGEEDQVFTGDSDDEKLVIDDSLSPPARQPKPKTTPCSADPPSTPVSESVTSESSPSQRGTRQKRQPKKAKVSGDQLSEILRMQTAMFSSVSDTTKCSISSEETKPATPNVGPSLHSTPVSLVKPCVSSYLERTQNQDGEACAAAHESAPVVNIPTPEHKSKCQIDLKSVDVSCVLCAESMHCVLLPPPSTQKYCHKTCRLVPKMNKITRHQRKATCSTSSTVCKMCC